MNAEKLKLIEKAAVLMKRHGKGHDSCADDIAALCDALEEAVGLLRLVDESILTPKHREYAPAIWDVHQFLRKWEEVGGE